LNEFKIIEGRSPSEDVLQPWKQIII